MKNLYMLIMAVFFICSCDRKDEEIPEPKIVEDIYDITKQFKTNFVFFIDELDYNAHMYWFDIMNNQIDPCCYHKSHSESLGGDVIIASPPYRNNTKTIEKKRNYLKDKFVISVYITDKVKRCSTCSTQRMYKSDSLTFKSIKDTIRVIRYPQDTVTFIKRWYPKGHPNYDPSRP